MAGAAATTGAARGKSDFPLGIYTKTGGALRFPLGIYMVIVAEQLGRRPCRGGFFRRARLFGRRSTPAGARPGPDRLRRRSRRQKSSQL